MEIVVGNPTRTAGEEAARTAPLPAELQVEVTAACNLRCRMCLVAYRPPLDRVRHSLGLAGFTRLVDENPNLERITLQGLGEPLLAPDLVAMVRYAADRNIRTGFNTNGTLLTRRRAEELIDAGLDWLHVSLDGATPGTYEAIRPGASFERVTANVSALARLLRERGAARPTVTLVFVAMRRNFAEIPSVVRLAARWGIGGVRVQNLSHTFDDCDPAGDYADIRSYAEREALFFASREQVEEVFSHAGRVAEELGVDLRLPAAEAASSCDPDEPGCYWPWRSAYVTAAGQVQPCCMVMGADRSVLGDARTESFAAIWNGDAYGRFRSGLLDGPPPEVCRGCSMYRGVF